MKLDVTSSDFPESFAQFEKDAACHEMTILHNDGVYRHLRFKAHESSQYWFDILTAPMLLTIHGDMGTFVFERLPDMLDFFRSYDINPDYWGSKLVAGKDESNQFSHAAFKSHVAEHFANSYFESEDERAETIAAFDESIKFTDLESGESAIEALYNFEYGDFSFQDSWEWDLTEPSPRFLWCLHAIRRAIAQYDGAQS